MKRMIYEKGRKYYYFGSFWSRQQAFRIGYTIRQHKNTRYLIKEDQQGVFNPMVKYNLYFDRYITNAP